jgi:hypothetical protein
MALDSLYFAEVEMEDGFVERECLLFEAGEYADRGVVITEDDLREIAANSGGEIPVRIEHLSESPFDSALGVVTGIRAVGRQLWGTLRQPVEAWRLAQRAGARALSVALDVAGKRILETSFVVRPRVAAARVFSGGQILFEAGLCVQAFRRSGVQDRMDYEDEGDSMREDRQMSSVRQFGEGLIQYIRGVMGGTESDSARFAQEREALEAERESIRDQRVEAEIGELKRQGLLRATESAEGMAREILKAGLASVVKFGDSPSTLAALFARFLKANGPVVPMGEILRADSGAMAGDRLISLAREEAKKENVPYVAAFARVSGAHPELARAAREEALRG